MKYLAGRTFDIGEASVVPGDELTEKQVDSIPHLESFISAGYIYPVATDKEYGKLPPHIFSVVQSRREAEAAIAAGSLPLINPGVDAAQVVVDSDIQVEIANRQATADEKFAELRNKLSGKRPGAELPVTDEARALLLKLMAPGDDQDATVVADDEPKESPAADTNEEAPSAPVAPLYDPSEHGVIEVREYLSQHPEDKERVLAAEAAGKNRATIMGL